MSIDLSSIYTSSLSSVYSTSMYSSSSVSSTSSLASTISSWGSDSFEISAEARDMASRPEPPDFDSMTDDEFREHITEMSDQLTAQGFDVSNIADMTTEELQALKDEMVEYGATMGHDGPPPPPPQQDASIYDSEAQTIDLQSWVYNALNQTFL